MAAAQFAPAVAYGEFSKGGVGSGVLTPPEVLVTQQSEPDLSHAQTIQMDIVRGSVSARPGQSLLFGALTDPHLRLSAPIPLETSNEDDEVIVTWSAIDEFGSGKTTGAALDDFGKSLRELYHHLHTKDIQLGGDLLRVKEVLDKYIAPRR